LLDAVGQRDPAGAKADGEAEKPMIAHLFVGTQWYAVRLADLP
jgi:hypothetical protein